MKNKKTVFINAALLSDPLRARFLGMFDVAARRSIVAWRLVNGPDAEVVLHEHPADDDGVGVSVYISDTPLSHTNVHLLRLEREFRVNALMDVLDLAAVRVLNRREQHAHKAPALPQQSDTRYRLRHWVFLGGEHADASHMRVLAAMSRRAVSRAWLLKNGGLNERQVDALLAELRLRGALVSEESPPSAATPTPAPATGVGTAASHGFVARLKRWIGGSRAATEPLITASGTR